MADASERDWTTTPGFRPPPGPPLPAIVQGIAMVARPQEFFEGCARRYGDNFLLRFPNNRPVMSVSHPNIVHAVFSGDPDQLFAGQGNVVLKPAVGPNSLLLLDGPRHRRDRKLMTPMFHGERMRAYGDAMRAVVNRHIDSWPVGKIFAIHPEMQAMTLDIILATVFGVEGVDLADFREALTSLLDFGTQSWFLLFIDGDGEIRSQGLGDWLGDKSPLNRFIANRDRVDELLFAEFARRRANPDPTRTDVLSLMMQARFDDGSAMSDRELRDEMMTLLLAGHETTATSLSWLLTWLYRYPGALQEIRTETARLGEGGSVPSEKIGELDYTFAAIKESLRKTPVIPVVVRRLQSEQTFDGLRLPKGAIVAPNIYVTHHRKDIWGDPERYRPERFLEKPVKPWHFFPFGGGNRTCLGMAFAYYEMKIAISEIARRTKFRLAPGYQPKLIRRNITFAPAKGVPIIFDRIER